MNPLKPNAFVIDIAVYSAIRSDCRIMYTFRLFFDLQTPVNPECLEKYLVRRDRGPEGL